MKKKIFALILCVVMVLAMSFTAFADTTPALLNDTADVLDSTQESEITSMLESVSDKNQADFVILTVESTEGVSAQEYAVKYYGDNGYGKGEDNSGAILLLDTEYNQWWIGTFGTVSSLVTAAQIEATGGAIEANLMSDDYYTACVVFQQYIDEFIYYTVQGMTTVSFENQTPPRLVDDAALLDSAQQTQLLSQLDEISERQQVDVVIVTVESTGGKTAEAFADDFFDFGGYGQGENKDGVLLLVSMEERDWHISTCGLGIEAVGDYEIETFEEKMVPYLSEGDYYTAFTIFAQDCDEYITTQKEGATFSFGTTLIAAIIVGVVIGFIVTAVMKSKLKSVRSQSAAADYVKSGSMKITHSSEYFLYKNVTCREKPKENTSSTHVSSSGTTHGGGGGKF